MNLILDCMSKKKVYKNLKFWIDGSDFKNSPPSTVWTNRVDNTFNFIPYNFLYTNTSGQGSDGKSVVITRDGINDYCSCVFDNNKINIKNGYTILCKLEPYEISGPDAIPPVSIFSADNIGFWFRTNNYKEYIFVIFNSDRSYRFESYVYGFSSTPYWAIVVKPPDILIYSDKNYVAKLPQSGIPSIANFHMGYQGNGSLAVKLYYAMFFDKPLSPSEIGYVFANNR